MEDRGRDTSVSPAETTIPDVAGATMAPPRFDEKSVQRAQPAVPLGGRPRVTPWTLTVAALCVLAGLAGGVVGAYVLSLYQRGGAARPEGAEATRAPAPPAATAADTTVPA